MHCLRDLLWFVSKRNLQRMTDLHANFSRPGKPAAGLPECKKSVNPYRNHRDSQIRRQQPCARAEWQEFAVFTVAALGKNEHAVSAVHTFTGIGKALPESRLARQREEIQQLDA